MVTAALGLVDPRGPAVPGLPPAPAASTEANNATAMRVALISRPFHRDKALGDRRSMLFHPGFRSWKRLARAAVGGSRRDGSSACGTSGGPCFSPPQPSPYCMVAVRQSVDPV